ncbi:hypothetical protein KF840_18775 [bacterium]|nr:hypothetical protein [bacterium]
MRTGESTGPDIRLVAAALVLAGCTAHMSPTPPRSPGEVAVINVGSTVVREIDGQHRRGGAFDVSAFEVAPGPHHLTLVFELPARALGLKSLPAQAGTGVCELTFEAQAGRQYYLLARPLGDFNSPRWSGAWEAWIRDPAIAADDDAIARCQGTAPAATPTPLIAGAAPAAAAPAAGAAEAVTAGGTPVATAALTPTPLPLPAARPLRVGAWRLPELADAAVADVAAAAAAIGADFDVLAISPALAPEPLLSALGGAWAAVASGGETVFYRRDLVRPCGRAAAEPCLEAIGAPEGAPLLLRLPPAAVRR